MGTRARQGTARKPQHKPALAAGIRAVLGMGRGLLLAGRLSDDQRKAVGWFLSLVAALTTMSPAVEVLG